MHWPNTEPNSATNLSQEMQRWILEQCGDVNQVEKMLCEHTKTCIWHITANREYILMKKNMIISL